jgi:hypothetical protein
MKIENLLFGFFSTARGLPLLLCFLFFGCSTANETKKDATAGSVGKAPDHSVSEFIVEGEQTVVTWDDDNGYTYLEVYAWGKFAFVHIPGGPLHLFLKQWKFQTHSDVAEPTADADWWDLGVPKQFTPSTEKGAFKAKRVSALRYRMMPTPIRRLVKRVSDREHIMRPTPIRRLVITPVGGGDNYCADISASPGTAPTTVGWTPSATCK